MVSPNAEVLRRRLACSNSLRGTVTLHNHAPAELLSSSASSLQKLIGEKCEALSIPWQASIVFPAYPVHGTKDDLSKIMSNPPEKIDICSYLKGKRAMEGNDRLYFCPKMYPPPADGDSEKEQDAKFHALNADLQAAADKAGCPIVVAAGRGGSKKEHRYGCGYCHREERPSRAKSDIPHRETQLVNNDKGGRRKGIGKNGSKRVKTPDQTHVCLFHFTVQYDGHGYYVTLKSQAGNGEHIGHPKLISETIPESTRNLTEDEVQDAKLVMESTCNKAAARNFLKTKFGKYLSYAQVAYLEALGQEPDKSEIDALMEMMEETEEIRYNILWSRPKSDGGGAPEDGPDDHDHVETVSTTKIGDDIEHTDIEDEPGLEALSEAAKKERVAQKIPEDEQVFHSIAWTNEKVFRLFKLNPEVMFCDVTSHTNRSGFHLLTFSIRTSIDKQVVFLRIWIPNQQRCSFRYVFQEAIKKLIPERHRLRVRFIMKDGDPQQDKEAMHAVKLHFRNAEIGGCGYHIVNMGWNRHVKGAECVPARNLDLWKQIIRGIHRWMYTWMRPGYCETEEEYAISKHLLLQFVTSDYVRRITGYNEVLVDKILTFIRKHVFVHEELYLHFRRKDLRHFDTAHSSAHEGTNFGLKSHSAAVKPTMRLDKSAAAMGIQDDFKAAECERQIFFDYRNNNKRWSNLPTAPYLTTYGEGLVKAAMERSRLYRARRIGQDSFQVVFVGDGCNEEFVKPFLEGTGSEAAVGSAAGGGKDGSDGDAGGKDDAGGAKFDGEDENQFDISDCAVPLFSRSYLVTLGPKSSHCSCCKHERTGLPCPHIICCANEVCAAQGKTFDGFLHTSIAVRWWSQYMYLGYRTGAIGSERDLVKLFHELAVTDVPGPKFESGIPDEMPVLSPVPDIPARDRLKNYPSTAVPSESLFDGLLSCTHEPNSSQAEEDALLAAEGGMPESSLPSPANSEAEEVFENSISNVVGAHKPGVGIRKALYPLWNEVTAVHGSVKSEQYDKQLEELLQGHLAEGRRLVRETNNKKGGADATTAGAKRKFVSIVSEGYEGTAGRVMNTKVNSF